MLPDVLYANIIRKKHILKTHKYVHFDNNKVLKVTVFFDCMCKMYDQFWCLANRKRLFAKVVLQRGKKRDDLWANRNEFHAQRYAIFFMSELRWLQIAGGYKV